ncbi:hypothetical protein E4T56_gene11399 [Termitomyces sp. T112]|nr:hypothetical protein E4T56_gene11399 [Termitomyces sp. T112]
MLDDEVPPPYSEQELDQKIARALVISVQQHQASQRDLTDDGEWEQWDEAAFAAAEARRNRITVGSNFIGSSGSRTYERHELNNTSPLPVPSAVQPLRIHKRGDSSVSGAPRSWMGDAISEEFYESSPSGHVLRNVNEHRHHDIPPDSDDEDHSIPPPPFASVDSQMDRIVRLEYHPESTPPSPLNSPNQFLVSPDSVHLSPQLGTAPRPPRQSLPIPSRSPNYHLQQRPASVIHPHQISASPHPVSNHPTHPSHVPDRFGQRATSTHPLTQTQSSHSVYLSTYKKTASTLPSQSQSFAASALYHSSVSGHLSSSMSMQPRVSHSSRQHLSPQIAQLQHTTLRTTDQTTSVTRPLGAAPANYLSNQSMSSTHPQVSSHFQHPPSATYFPQHPTFPTQHGDPTIPRWATSEQQLNQNFQ